MRVLNRLFGETKITWPILILYSVVTGAVVGLLNCVPFLEETSFVAPAVTLEYWFVAALFVITNCKSAGEAAIKTFVFFLISQPVIYLVEVPFKAMGWELFKYYGYWAKITVLTLPGAWIAYQVKRDNVLSALILSVATGFLLSMGIAYTRGLLTGFPKGLVAAVFCFAFGILFIPVILKKKKTRIVAFVVSFLIAAAMFVFILGRSSDRSTGILLDAEHTWEVVETDATVSIEGNYMTVKMHNDGTYYVTVRDENGALVTFEVIFDGSTVEVREKE